MRSLFEKLINRISHRRVTAMVLAIAMVISVLYFGPTRTEAADELLFHVNENMTVDGTTEVTASDGNAHTFDELAFVEVEPGVTLTMSGEMNCPSLKLNTCTAESKLVIASGATITVDSADLGSTTTVNGTFVLNTLTLGDEETAILDNHGTVQCSTFVSNSSGVFHNYGNFIVPNFDSKNLYGPFENESTGVVTADTVNMYIDYENPYSNNLVNVQVDTANAAYRVTTSLTVTGYNSQNIGNIFAEPDTLITIDGGGFYLTVGDKEPVLVWGGISGAKASDLVKKTPEFTEDFPTTWLYGVTYDALDYVTCTSDATITATYYEANPEDEDDMTLIGTTAPKEVGSYRVVYSVPRTDEYEAAEYSCDYAIDYLDVSVSACQVSGTKADEQYNGYDVFTGKVTFTAPEGYEIKPTSVVAEAFSDTFVLDEDGYYEGLIAQYRRKSDGAITESKYAYNASFYVNAKAPELEHVWDQDDNELELNDSNTYGASTAYVRFKDVVNIKSVKVNGVTVTDTEVNGLEYTATLAMTGVEDETFTVEVTGQSGRTAEYSITLQNVLMDAPDNPYTIVGTEGDNGFYTSDVVLRPAEGYLISSSLGGDYQESLAYTEEITEIWLKNVDSGRYTASVEVDPIHIDKQAPVIKARLSMNGDFVQLNDGDDLNFKSMMLYVTDPEQNLASFSINGEQAIGISPYGRYETIDASKSTKETDTLVAKDKAGNTTTITISYQDLRQDAECTLSVPDYEAGGTFSPVLTTDHDLKDQVKYTFNDGIYDNFTETIPTEVGEYEVRAYIPASDTYNEIEIYEYFDVTKKSPTLSISVEDIDYGGTLAPEIENNTGTTAKVEYKLRSEEDDAYTETKPTMPGLYTARVSVVETEEYQAASEVDDFEIRKLNDTSASVTVPNVTVGQEYAPTLTTVSDGKASAEFFYKQADEDDSNYTKTPPTAAGTYQVVARVPETEIYLAVNPVHVFKILKKTPTKATITVEDLVIDDELTPVVDTDSDGEKVVEYKKADATDTTYDETPPTAAGTYMARLTVRESETYEEIVSEPDEFTISKKTVSATVEVSDCEVGDTITPKVTTVSDGKEETTFKYKLETDPVEAYDGDVPTAAGTYMVLATVPETNNFKKIECTDTFTIKKKTATYATVTVADIEWDGTITPVITSDSDGKDDPTYKYKLQSQGEEDYSTDVPTAIGDYDILAILAETETYLPISCEGSFSITRKTVGATVTVANVEFGGTISPVVETESDGKKDTTFEYKLQSQGEEDYTGDVPTAVGDYDIRATVPMTANYFATTAEGQFKITKNTVVSATVTVEDIYVGGTLNPVVETVSDGKSGATFEYKLQSQGVDQYDGTVPTAAGDYNIRATIPATASYEEIICTGTFSILKKTPTYATVTVADILVNQTPNPSVATDSNGIPTYKYKLKTETAYSDEIPTAAGEYDVLATVPETESFTSITCTGSFEIKKKTATYVNVTVADIEVDETPSPSTLTDSDGIATYKYKLKTETTYSGEVPTAAGEYDVLATVPETENFYSITGTGSFEIKKKTATYATVTVADTLVDGTLNPEVNTDSNGTPTYTFKKKTDTTYDGTVPTAAGEYDICATISETATYNEIVCYGSFEIKKKTATYATVTVADTLVDGTLNPEVDTDSNGTPTYTYKKKTDTTYDGTVPTAAGEYDICATVSETATYNEIVCYGSFEIKKKTATRATVTVADTLVGGTLKPEVDTDSNGTPTYTYKKKTDSTYDVTVPTAAGEYDICATIPETETYNEVVCYGSFKITKKKVTYATVTVADILVDGTVNPSVDTDSNGIPTYTYKKKTDTTYDVTVPTAAGEYDICATIPETETYESDVCYGSFKILKKTPASATVTVADITVGGTISPVVSTDSNGTPAYTYKKKTESTYTATIPTAGGEYDICATIPETETYYGTECYGSFKINRLTPTLSLTVSDDIELDQTLYMEINTNSDGKDKPQIEYREKSGTTYVPSQPNALGEYEVRVTIPMTDNYESVSATKTFKILKKTYYGDITASDVEYGEPLDIDLDTRSDGRRNSKYEYKRKSDPVDLYDEEEPTAVGEYSVRVTVPETDTYYGEVYEATFKIVKAVPESSLTVENIEFGGTVKPVCTTNSNGTVTYKYKRYDEAESEYGDTVPTAVGTYNVKAVIAETANYKADEVTKTFRITKTIVTATVTIADIKVGGTLSPVVETVSNGAVSYEYKKTTDSTYGTEVPTAAGEYDFRATIAETTDYEEIVCTGSFRIVKKTTTATLIVDDILVGGKVKPKVDTVSDGKVTIEYRSTDDDASTYTEKVPTAAGEYDVRATVAETATYKAIVCTGGFRIRKKTATGTLTVKDIVEGGKVDPSVKTDSDGKITFKYKKVSDTAYTTDVPTEAGEYDVCAMVSATATYKAFECYGSFTITKKKVPEKKTATLTVSIEDCEVGDKVAPKVKTNSDGTPKIEYKKSSEGADAYSETVPTKAGTYSIRVTIPETENYKKTAYAGTFTISKKRPMLSVSLNDVYRGTGYTPATATNSDGKISFMYKAKTAADSAYSEDKPTAVGEYMVLATVSETATYMKATAVAEFAIRYLAKPDEDCDPEGEEGENGYYTSDVYLDAPDGYLISATKDGTYAERIPYTPGMTVYYLKRVSDGALTDTVQIPGEIKIDKLLPEAGTMLDQAGNPINTNGLAYADSVKFTISDENLASVTVNGMPVSIINHVAEVILNPGNDTVTFKIMAKDIAGNGVEIGITIAATWIREGVVPEGTPLPLKTGKAYTMPAGAWITDSNDGMTYSGNRQFYVRVSQDYTFTKSK